MLQGKYTELYHQSLKLAKHKAKALSKLNSVELEKEKLQNELVGCKFRVTELETTVESLKKNEEKLSSLNMDLEKEVEELRRNIVKTTNSFKKWELGTKKLDDILEAQRSPDDKAGLGCREHFSTNSSKGAGPIKFVSATKGEEDDYMDEKMKNKEVHGASKVKNFTRGNNFSNYLKNYGGKKFSDSSMLNSISGQHKKFVPTCHHCGIKGHIRPHCHKLYGLPFDYIKSKVFPHKKVQERAILSNRFSVLDFDDYTFKKGPFKPNVKRFQGGFTNSGTKTITKTIFKGINGSKNNVRKAWIRCNDLNCFVAHTAFRAQNSNLWYLDSGCSKHMCGVKSMFSSLKDCDEGFVTFGDGNKSKILGIGCIECPGLPKLKDVLYVDGLKANLISISQICDSHYNVLFAKDMCSILDRNNNVVLKGSRTSDNCYVLSTDCEPVCHIAQDDTIELWHQRLRQVDYRELARLSKSEIVRGLPKLTKVKKRTSRGCFYIRSNLVVWQSKKQNSISLSIVEAKYITARSCCAQVVWMKQMVSNYGIERGIMSLFCDILSAINISKNAVQHSRTMHIDIRHHFIRDLIERHVLTLEHIPANRQLADILTKPLDASRFEYLHSSLGVILLE